MYNKKPIITLMILAVSLITGCWDNIEIDERAFITGIGFDKYEGGKEDKEDTKQIKDKYIQTITYPNVAIIAGKGEGDPSYVHSTIGSSPSDGKQQINIRNNKNFYITQTKIIVIGKKLAEDENLMREIIDVLQRSVYINRKVYFMYTPSTAKEILETDTKKAMDVGLYIEELMDKEQMSSRHPRTDFNKMIIDLRESNAAMIPQIVKSKEDLKVAGAAIFKNSTLIGTLDEIETRNVLILKDETSLVDYTLEINDLVIVIEEMNLKSKMKVYEKEDGKIAIDFNIRSEGVMLQHYFMVHDEPYDVKYLEKANKEAADLITEQLKKTFKKVQKEYRVDIFKAGEYLRKHEYETWEKVKGNWDKIYPEAEVNIKFDMNIRRVGIER